MAKLWQRAYDVLPHQPRRRPLEGLAFDLLKAREMDEQAIYASINDADAPF